ncbi:F3I6.9 PROTEIN [Salix koriyanagi]|uniref:F3I6.9 PROTEIN n=1 Tax=Salix koriyanagi TaxID=2511006 RepID=A0A9Q0WRL6_9ROSI|nr:F3I6.9 PROTEIN [Salix koriyanagi]
MGESLVAASSYEDKIGGTNASDPALQVSVSFGRFENDSLSWDKWSSFSQNKYLEEVEKCATPGSVAEKRAYFEAHYKKIAARKAELLDQDLSTTNNQNSGDVIVKTGQMDSDFDASNGQTSAEGVRLESKLDNEWDGGHIDEPNEDAAIDAHGQASMNEPYEDTAIDAHSQVSSNKPCEDAAFAGHGQVPLNGRVKEEQDKKEMESILMIKEEKVKLDHHKESPKISPMSKVRDIATAKKKPEPPVTKRPQNSTLKFSKPVSTSSSLSASQSFTKKVNGSSLPRSKNSPVGGNKKVTSKSLQMSLGMDSPNSETAPLTNTRKSLIMEKMGDKDIVKRAFKTFQNNFSQLKSSAEERSIGAKQMPAKETGVKVSTSMTPRKENIGSFKSGVVDRRTAKLAPSSFVLKSDERVDRRKEEEREAEIKNLRQSLNFKAMPMPGFYRGLKASKGPLDKEGSKTLQI